MCRWLWPDGFVGDDWASKRNARWLMDTWFFAGVLIAATAVISLFFFLPPGVAVAILLLILIVLLLLLGNKGFLNW